MPSNRERKRELREKQILVAAAHIMSEVGYAALTMDTLAERAGVAKATLYTHFRSKNDLMLGATARAFDNLAVFMDTLGENLSAVDRLRAVMRYMMRGGDDPDGFVHMVLHDEMVHLFREDQGIGETFGRLNAILSAWVTDAQAVGDIGSDLSPPFVISLMMTLIRVVDGQAQVYPDAIAGRSVTIEQTIRVFFDGLRSCD